MPRGPQSQRENEVKAKHTLIPAVAMVLAASVAPNVGAQESPQAKVPQYPPSVTVLDQKLDSNEISIAYAYMPKDGKLTILSGDPEKKSEASVLGSVELPAGD